MKILAIDSSNTTCSLALYNEGVIYTQENHEQRQHAKCLLPMLEHLMQESNLNQKDLNAVAFSRGPGSFTGLRISAAFTQGIAYGLSIPIIAISSLQALAQQLTNINAEFTIVASIDARMQEVYYGFFTIKNGIAVPVSQEKCAVREKMYSDIKMYFQENKNTSMIALGDGWPQMKDAFPDDIRNLIHEYHPQVTCRAREVITIAVKEFNDGNIAPAEAALPNYLRELHY